jgi:hypothetical protein
LNGYLRSHKHSLATGLQVASVLAEATLGLRGRHDRGAVGDAEKIGRGVQPLRFAAQRFQSPSLTDIGGGQRDGACGTQAVWTRRCPPGAEKK